MPGGYRKISDLPQAAPLFPLDGVLLLPRGQLPLNIFEPRYLNMLDDVMGGDRILGVLQTRPGGERTKPALARVGCVGRVTSFAETGDGRYILTLTGACRFRLGPELNAPTPYRQARLDYTDYAADLEPPPELDESRPLLLSALRAYPGAARPVGGLGRRGVRAARGAGQQPVHGAAVRRPGEAGAAGGGRSLRAAARPDRAAAHRRRRGGGRRSLHPCNSSAP